MPKSYTFTLTISDQGVPSMTMQEVPPPAPPAVVPPPVVLPPVVVVPPTGTKWLGTNLLEVRDWMTDEPFIDHLKHRRQWTSTTPNGGDTDGRTLNLDKDGNVISLLPGQVAQSYLWTGTRRAGSYFLEYDPTNQATQFTFKGCTAKPVAGHPKIELTVPEQGAIAVVIAPDANGVPPKLKRLTHKDDTTGSYPTFSPRFVAKMSKYACLRFMDWQQTNYTRTQAEQARDYDPTDTFSTYADAASQKPGISVPIVTLIELCNVAKTNGWICVPYGASDSYVKSVLGLIQTKLNAGLKFYVEHSNEMWNGMFPQHQAAKSAAGGDYNTAMMAHARRSSEIAKMCKDHAPTKTISVLGWWVNNVWGTQNFVNMFAQEKLTKPDVLAVAPYIGGGNPDKDTPPDYGKLPDDPVVFTDGRWDFDVNTFHKLVQDHIQAYGQGQVVAYEGGAHILSGGQGGAVTSKHPGMEAAYDRMLQSWATKTGNALFCHFSHVGSYSSSGSWGEKEHFYQAETPKSKAIGKVLGR